MFACDVCHNVVKKTVKASHKLSFDEDVEVYHLCNNHYEEYRTLVISEDPVGKIKEHIKKAPGQDIQEDKSLFGFFRKLKEEFVSEEIPVSSSGGQKEISEGDSVVNVDPKVGSEKESLPQQPNSSIRRRIPFIGRKVSK